MSIRDRALNWKKSAQSHMQSGLGKIVGGARWFRRHLTFILLCVVGLASLALTVYLDIVFWMWLFAASPVIFWILLVLTVAVSLFLAVVASKILKTFSDPEVVVLREEAKEAWQEVKAQMS